MKEQLEHLIELQNIDLKILNAKQKIDSFPLKIAQAELTLREFQTGLDKIIQKLDLIEKKKREKEGSLDDINEKIGKIKGRISEIKTNKEYQAHLMEIESVEKERYAIEDAILLFMEQIDAILKQKKSEEDRMQSERNRINEFKRKLEQEMQEAEREMQQLKDTRLKITETIDSESYSQYMSLFETYNGLAVVEVKEEICMGCNMNVPPQLYVEVKKKEEIFNCPQCRRILFFRNST
jgi:predicted  nucleic acid-binding Zn-ribbon protein